MTRSRDLANLADSTEFTSADNTKLDGIETSATADQTNAEIRSAVEAATDSNVFTDADHTKLNAIEASATADQTNAEIKTAVEAATNIALGGSPTTTTQAESDDSTKVATTAYVTDKITTLIGGAPSTLNDLNELAAAINDDANYNSTLTTALATKLPLAGGTVTGNVSFGDNNKAIFGTGSDLQIYHDGSNSYIDDAGAGDLRIRGENLQLADLANKNYITCVSDGAVGLRFNDAQKLATSNTGIDVTGTIAADTLDITEGTNARLITSDGISEVGSGNFTFQITNSAGSALKPLGFRGEDIRFATQASERMRIDSSGNLIKSGGVIKGERGTASAPPYSFSDDSDTGMFNISNAHLGFSVGGAERMRIDSSGNLLVGHTSQDTPVDNGGAGVTLRPQGVMLIGGTGTSIYANREDSDGEIVQFRKDGSAVGSIGTKAGDFVIGSSSGSDAAFRMDGTNNQIYASDTSGAARDGAISLGASTVRWKDLYLSGTAYMGNAELTTTTAGQISAGNARQGSILKLHHEAQWEAGYNSSPTDFLGALEFSSGDTSGSGAAGEGVRAAIRASVGDAYNNVALSFETGGTRAETMRLTHNGRLGINTSDPGASLSVNGPAALANLGGGATSSSALYINTKSGHVGEMFQLLKNGATKLQIQNNGDICVGKSSVSDSTLGFQIEMGRLCATQTSGSTYHLHDTSSFKFYVNANGGIYNYQSNNVNLSDQREKKNIEELGTKWDAVKAWSVKEFHYNADEDSDAKKVGVIAQDVETNHSELVTDFNLTEKIDEVKDDDGNITTEAVAATTRKAVKEQQMMWMAIKALQEAQTRIEELEIKVAALEA